MTAGAFVSPDLAIRNYFGPTNLLGATATNFKLALVTSAWSPNNTTDEVFADVTNELVTGGGYTAGGVTLTGVAVSQTAGVAKFTSAAAVFNATGAGIPAWRRAVVYYNGTLNGKVNPIVAHMLGDAAPADVPTTTAGNPLTVTMHANGIVNVSRAP